jgi:predicted site-specific integrase-resolvase
MPREVAEIFSMSRSGVIKWIREGKIKALEINSENRHIVSKYLENNIDKEKYDNAKALGKKLYELREILQDIL